MKCKDTGHFNPEDCADKNTVVKAANKVAEKRLNDKLENFEVSVNEEDEFYTITYNNRKLRRDSLTKGGGDIYLKISKKDCKIIEYYKLK